MMSGHILNVVYAESALIIQFDLVLSLACIVGSRLQTSPVFYWSSALYGPSDVCKTRSGVTLPACMERHHHVYFNENMRVLYLTLCQSMECYMRMIYYVQYALCMEMMSSVMIFTYEICTFTLIRMHI